MAGRQKISASLHCFIATAIYNQCYSREIGTTTHKQPRNPALYWFVDSGRMNRSDGSMMFGESRGRILLPKKRSGFLLLGRWMCF